MRSSPGASRKTESGKTAFYRKQDVWAAVGTAAAEREASP